MNGSCKESSGNLAGFETGPRPAESLVAKSGRATGCGAKPGAGVWPRILVLLAMLCLIKLALLVTFRKHLFEIHWRIGSEPFGGLNETAFDLFALLLGLQLWMFGTHCMAAGNRLVRSANGCVLLLGAFFILLTFHEGDKNYLDPVMNGVLSWASLRWYLALDFCFRPPYLLGWILGYSLVYYALARSGRERLALRLTAICATAYCLICLRGFMKYTTSLAVLDCVGAAAVLALWNTTRGVGLRWMAVFLAGIPFVFGIFYGLSPKLSFGHWDPEFVILTATGLSLVTAASLYAWRSGFFRGWSCLLPFCIAAFLLLTNINYVWAPNYAKLISAGLTLPRYFLGEAILAGFLFLPALAYRRLRPGGSLWWLDALCFSLIAFALADLRLSQIMGERLDWRAVALGMGETPRMMWRMSRPYLPGLFGVLMVVGVIYAFFLRIAGGAGGAVSAGSGLSKPRLSSGAMFCGIAAVLLGLAGECFLEPDKAQGESALRLALTSPVWKRALDPAMDRASFASAANRLGMTGLLAPIPGATRPQRDLNVVLIFQESSYNKYLSMFDGTEETQPLLSQYKDRMEVFPNFFSSFAGSIQARFAAFTGLYPVQDYKDFTLDHVGVRSIFELLHDRGYACSLFYSSFFDYTGFRDFLNGREIENAFDADTMPGARTTKPVSWGLREEETLGAIQAQIKGYAASKRKFFLTYVPAAPHNPFDGTPARFCKFQRGQADDYSPLYRNELLYMDWVISSILGQLKDSGLLDHTLVVITDDHGEMLGENGGPIGHGWAVTPELANIPLIILDPGRHAYRVDYTVGSQVDLPPTILDLLGLPFPDQLCQGTSLYRVGATSDRTIYLSSLSQYGIIRGRDLICGDRGGRDSSGAGDAYEITNQGARTVFAPLRAGSSAGVSISAFDRFQQNLLHHYSEYCRWMEGGDGGRVEAVRPAPGGDVEGLKVE